MLNKKVSIVIVDDSNIFLVYLTQMLASEESVEVLKTFRDPREALLQIPQLRPDVMIVDMEMPGMRGDDFLRRALPANPGTRAIVASALSDNVFDAMHAGAIDFIEKPFGTITGDDFLSDLMQKISIAVAANPMAVASRKPLATGRAAPSAAPARLSGTNSKSIIAIGASTGGTEAILEVVRNFPPDTPGVVMVQHMPAGFTKMFVDRINDICHMEVREAVQGDRVKQGLILLAPGGDRQMRLKRDSKGYYVQLSREEKVNGHCPSVGVLFDSVADISGADAVGVLLTGMGADGAEGLKKMRQAGAYTIGQDEKTCVVYGMPKVAFEIGAVARQLPLKDISAAVLRSFSGKK